MTDLPSALNLRVLVIDDNESLHRDFRSVLVDDAHDDGVESRQQMRAALFHRPAVSKPATMAFEMSSAYQGQEGIDMARQAHEAGRPFAAAFVDMRMPPGLDGVETISQLWQVDPGLQVIICTAYADYSWDEIVATLGQTDQLLLLKKPFDSAEVWQLACALTKKWYLTKELEAQLQDLDAIVQQRTAELKVINRRLETEVHERRQAEQTAIRVDRILDGTLNEIYILQGETLQFMQANRGARQNLGYTLVELESLTPLDIAPECSREFLDELLAPLRSGAKERVYFRTSHRRKDGSMYPVEAHVQRSMFGNEPVFVAIVLDISERKAAEEQLQHAATHDTLTNLPNRALLMDRIDQCFVRVRRNTDFGFAVLFFDLDNFKLVNDSLGHNAGDELLIQVARRLTACLRSLDSVVRLEEDLAARLGGDEFVILLDGIRSTSDTVLVAERLLNHLTAPFEVAGQEIMVNASIGIAMSSDRYESAHELPRDADTAMYRAKGAGRAQFAIFDQAMHSLACDRLQLENDLRRALKRQEFHLVYQPIVAIPEGKTVAFEALIRWDHPSRGAVSPDKFIPVAEESGLIVPIGKWVLAEACRQFQEWRSVADGCGRLRINVNVSRRQLLDPGLPAEVERVIGETGVEGRCVNLEITESTVIEDSVTITERLAAIRSLGVGIHMDDFGTGYSSLSCLHRFPLDVVKIDRAFVDMIGSNRDYTAIIQAIITLAHSLKMQVTVEGIETRDQLEQIAAIGCQYAQGFFFSKALAADDVISHLRRESTAGPVSCQSG